MPIDKVAIIGLDCGEPSLAFEKWGDLLPKHAEAATAR